MKHQVHILDTGERYACDAGASVLSGMEALGRKGIPVGCRNGGCGVCKIQIVSGTFEMRVMSRAHVSEAEQAQGKVLACRIQPRDDLELRVIGHLKKCFEA